MTRFFRQALRYLTDSGRILIFFGTSGDLAYLLPLIDNVGFLHEVVAQRSLIEDGWQIDYFTFRLIA